MIEQLDNENFNAKTRSKDTEEFVIYAEEKSIKDNCKVSEGSAGQNEKRPFRRSSEKAGKDACGSTEQ